MEEVFRIGYFNWWLVAGYILLLAIFLYGLLQPRQKSEWRSAGAAQAWVIALYAEMYGWPLTAYLAMGWLGRTPADAETHFNGHLWPMLIGVPESYLVVTQFIFTVVGQGMILVGALLSIFGWRQLHRAAVADEMATTGLYRWIRHPQYTGFFLFLLGSVINWPTLITVLTLPILCWVYWRLAVKEEALAIEEFGQRYLDYMKHTGRFLPRWSIGTSQ
ncbi:MAG: isoprenylcysteine carboxylmethyltransferase family protein [Planctomycetota bacterium]